MYGLCLLPSGELASGGWDHSIRIWDLDKGTCKHLLTGHPNPVLCLLIYNGKLVSGDNKGLVKVWSLENYKCIKHIHHGNTVWIYDLLEMDNGSILSVCNSKIIALKMWDFHTVTSIRNFAPSPKEPRGFRCGTLFPNKTKLLLGGLEGNLMILNTYNWMFETNIRLHTHRITQIALLNEQDIITSSHDGNIKVTNIKTSKILKTLDAHSQAVFSILPILN